MFFLSSRRRHTRSLRDWSSDVCSSDLTDQPLHIGILPRGSRRSEHFLHSHVSGQVGEVSSVDRSEERRVGKECRSRWSRSQLKKTSPRYRSGGAPKRTRIQTRC